MADKKNIVKGFCDRCIQAKLHYDMFVSLYESGQQRLDLMKDVAFHFFHDLQRIIIDYLLLEICKLTDPAFAHRKNQGLPNLSIKYILQQDWPKEVYENLTCLSNEIHIFRQYIDEYRRKILAHNDWNTYSAQTELGSFPREELDKFWKYLQDFINIIHNHCFDSYFSLEIAQSHDAEVLVDHLKKALLFDTFFDDKQLEKFDLWQGSLNKYRDA